jgi:hypothetical protein
MQLLRFAMTDFTLTIPEDLYLRAHKIAETIAQPVEAVLLEQLRLWTEAVPLLAVDEEAELQALRYLSDDALWTMAREQMPDDLQHKMQSLMDKNSTGAITSTEMAELSQLVERGQQLMLRKSEAAALLTKRGHTVTRKDMAKRE